MRKDFPIHPKHPERICWGCDQKCQAKELKCGNGSERTPHPVEWWGEGWEKENTIFKNEDEFKNATKK